LEETNGILYRLLEFTGSHAAVCESVYTGMTKLSVNTRIEAQEKLQAGTDQEISAGRTFNFLEGTIFVLQKWRFWIDHNVTILD